VTTLDEAFRLHQAGRYADASRIYVALLAETPDNADALNLLASATRSLGDAASAYRLAKRAAEIAPFRPDIFYNLGNAAQAAGHLVDAIEAWAEAVRLEPGHADAHANLGVAYGKQGRYEEAVGAYARALDLKPDHRIAGHNIGNALGEIGRGREATAAFRAVIARYPDLAEARYNLSLALLRLGDFGEGFAQYEARWRSADFSHPPRHTGIADWDGSLLAGRRLLVHAEQGLGDTLQFVRLLKMLAGYGGKVTFEAPAPLVRLLRPFAEVAEIVAEGRVAGRHDCQTPLLGLPLRLGLTLGSVPAAVPYLAAEREATETAAARLKPDRRPIVGLMWRGNPASPADRGRSIRDPDLLAPLRSVKGVRFVALAKLSEIELTRADTPTGWAVKNMPMTVEHLGPDFDTGGDAFIATAAVIALARAVVTTDTSIAHLAGAMARSTIVLLKRVPDWRWLAEGETTPWYPALRLVRQTEPGDWLSVTERAARALAGLV
jgi:tetratricopeptide (TPR) repeat protein